MDIAYFPDTIIPKTGLPLDSIIQYRKYYECLAEVTSTINTIQVNIQCLERDKEMKGLKTFYERQLAFWQQHKDNLINYLARGGRTDYN